MVTSLNTGVPARDSSYQLLHFLRKAINVASTATGTVVTVGKLPAGAIVMSPSGVWVTTDLTGGGSTNNINVGFATDSLASSNATAYASVLNLTTTTGGYVAFDELTTGQVRGSRSVETTVTATWTGSATSGVFEVIVAYVQSQG